MPLTLSLMQESDIPAFAVVDAAAMTDWGMARVMDSPSEPRQQMVERWTRADFRNDDEQAWVIVREDETGELVAAAMWGFYPAKAELKVDADAPTEVEPKKEMGEREQIFNLQEGLAAIGRTSKAFKDEFIGGKGACL